MLQLRVLLEQAQLLPQSRQQFPLLLQGFLGGHDQSHHDQIDHKRDGSYEEDVRLHNLQVEVQCNEVSCEVLVRDSLYAQRAVQDSLHEFHVDVVCVQVVLV